MSFAERRFAALAATLAVPPAIFAPTTASMVRIWMRSDTFAHCFLIVPLALYLIWRQRAELAALPASPSVGGLALLAGAGLLWLAADLADVGVLRQLALAGMLPLVVLTVFGGRIARHFRFPLLFLLFAVPFGEALVAPLIDLTAGFTAEALRVSGIPVLREGNQLTLPSGTWGVIEACSGVRYLIASVTLGALFAHLFLRSRRRQLAFLIASAVLPVLANGLRAYGIVLLGHLSGRQLAAGLDHVIYGWLFFGALTLLLFWSGMHWREDAPPPARPAPAGSAPAHTRMAGMAVAVLGILLVWPLGAYWLAPAASCGPEPRLVNFAPALAPATDFTDWQPQFGARARLRRTFQTPHGVASAMLFYYRDERRTGARLVTSTNRLADEATGWVCVRQSSFRSDRVPVQEAELLRGQQRLLVWSWYRVGATNAAADWRAKLLQVGERLRTGHDDALRLVLFAPLDQGRTEARAALAHLQRSALTALTAVAAAN